MELTQNQTQIETAIRNTCTTEPVATVGDIAKRVPFSEQTILNNIDAIVEARRDIETKTIGQAIVVYVSPYSTDEIWTEKTTDTMRLNSRSEAAVVELREAPDEDDFDLYAHWYDDEMNELEDYEPLDVEIGQALAPYINKPVSIKFY